MEGGENFTPSQIVKERPKLKSEIIEFREKQSSINRLAEYIIGLKFDDPNVSDRLTEDKKIIRTKYGLPDMKIRFANPDEYNDRLMNLAKNNEVTVREMSDCGDYVINNKDARAFYSQENKTIGINLDKTDKTSYMVSLGVLEHEVIHAIQDKKYPEMNIELKEYEACMSGLNTYNLKENFGRVESFFSSVAASVGHWYGKRSEEMGYEVKPAWDSPEYFLKNVDGFSDKEIEDYKRGYPPAKADALASAGRV